MGYKRLFFIRFRGEVPAVLFKFFKVKADLFFPAAVGGLVILFGEFRGQILLRDESLGVVMRVLVVEAAAQFLGRGVMGVAEVVGNGGGSAFTDIFTGLPDGLGAAIAFGGAGDVNGGLGEGQLGFGKADKFADLDGGGG